MPMLNQPSQKYRPFELIDQPNRQWPSRRLDKPPIWLSTDLRDGNQALVNPMSGQQKKEFFRMLLEIGFKEIEISYPSSGHIDYEFTRDLVTTPNAVPDDVWIQVLTPCRQDLIETTIESVRGANNVILHLYIATSHCFRQVVLGKTFEDLKTLAVDCTRLCRLRTKDNPDCGVKNWRFQFSSEAFSDTNLDLAVEICDAVKEAWQPSEQNPMILNLAATVEMSTPNVFADQVEYFCTHISEPQKVIVSLHPHNDRGCAVAAAELAQLAGASRVEGTLFGNGERTGNVDLVTLALNLYTQGVHPNLDFSDLRKVVEIVERSNGLPIPDRWPYAGSLVACAFSGAHQDAIKKGLDLRDNCGASYKDPWRIPYLPYDPRDFGRNLEDIIRVNSQSGKGGSAWVVQQRLGLDLPRGLQIDFSNLVQQKAQSKGRELLADEVSDLFETSFDLRTSGGCLQIEYSESRDRTDSFMLTRRREDGDPAPARHFKGKFQFEGVYRAFSGTAGDPHSHLLEVFKDMGIPLTILEREQDVICTHGRRDPPAKYVTYARCSVGVHFQQLWGVGIHEDQVQSSLLSILRVFLLVAANGDIVQVDVPSS